MDHEALMSWKDLGIFVGVPLLLVILGWVLKQVRDTKVDTFGAVKELSAKVSGVRQEVQQYREGWLDRREALINIIAKHCGDSQSSCMRLWQVQIDSLKKGQVDVCNKIDALNVTRNNKWTKQDRLNQRFLEHILDKKVHEEKGMT